MSLLGFDPNQYRTTTAAKTQPQEQGRLADMVDSFQAGAASGLGGIFDFVGADGMAKSLYGIADDQQQQMSSRGREAMAKQMFTEDANGNVALGEGMTDLDTWLLQMANVAGQFVPTALPGGLAAKAATTAFKLGNTGAKVAQSVAMGATGGSAAQGQAMDQGRQEVLRMPDKVLAESDLFKQTFLSIDAQSPELDDNAKWDLAKNTLAERVASDIQADPKALLANFAASAIGDPIIGRALTGARLAKSGALRSALVGGVTEGSTEMLQAGTSQYAINQQLAKLDGREAMQGVTVAALNEGAVGAGFGGVAGGIGGIANREPAKNPAADPLRDTNPTVAATLDVDAQQAENRRADMDLLTQATNYDQPTAARRAGMGEAMNAGRFGDEVIARDNAMKGRSFPTVPEQANPSPLTQAMDNVQRLADQRVEGEWLPPETAGSSPVTGLLGKSVLDGDMASTVLAMPPDQLRLTNHLKGDASKHDGSVIAATDKYPLSSQGIFVKGNNLPFASAKEALASKRARAAKREGGQIEAVKLDKGFGWRVVPKRDTLNADQAANKEDDGASPEPVTASPAAVDAKAQPAKKPDPDTAEAMDKPTPHKVSGLSVVEAPLTELTLSADVPQFKDGANSNGVVEPLGGKFERTGVAPIQVWVRRDGRKEIISGRHRVDLARRSGEQTIPAQYHYEADGFTSQQAAALDATLNIREGQGKVKDYVDFIQATELNQEEANAQGILARATGQRAYTIATQGTDALITAHRADVISDEAATRIASAAPNNEALQAVGLKAIQDGKSISIAHNLIKAVQSLTGNNTPTSGDLFGFDDSAMKEAEALARSASRKQAEIQRTLSAVQGAAKRPDLAAAEGVDVKDPKALTTRIDLLKQQKQQWDNWHTNPKLVAELKGSATDNDGSSTGNADIGGFDLTQETDAQRSIREAAEARARQQATERRRTEDAKLKADEDLNGFTLTGSDSQADVGMAHGQGDIFSQPEAKPKAEQPKPAVSSNTIFTDEAAAAARKKLREMLGITNSGFNPEMMQAGITLAGYHIEKGARTFAAYAKAMMADMGDAVTPYLKSWYMGVKYDPRASAFDGMDSAATVDGYNLAELEKENAQYSTSDPQSDRQGRTNTRSAAEKGAADDERGPIGSTAANDGNRGGRKGQSGDAVADGVSDAHSAGSIPAVRDDKSRLADDVPRDIDNIRSLPDSTAGIQPESTGAQAVEQIVKQAPEVSVKAAPLARVGAHRSADIEQIRASMPFLTPGQVEDVAFAETRFSQPDGTGVLFTNGTGTGKTFLGLGVVRRFVEQGKENVLVITKSQPIIDAWASAAKKFFNLQTHTLSDTKDSGKGITLTTFANLIANPGLIGKRDFDLIIADESQYLSSDKDGTVTKALKAVRAIAKMPGTALTRVNGKHPELADKIAEGVAALEQLRAGGVFVGKQHDEIHEWLDPLVKQRSELEAIERQSLASMPVSNRPKTLLLSATPLAYEKNVVIGQGLLYDWNEGMGDNNGSAYNSGDNYDRFMMQHFGYRMRYNKLTEPEAEVDRGLMQRQFNAWLKQRGVLSGRTLDSDFDYDRRFIMTESAIGKRVDDALKWFSDNRSEEVSLLREKIVGENFSYHARMYFLEAIKAREALPIIKDHLALGRRVVVMHDFKQGGAVNPFWLSNPEPELIGAYELFKHEFSDLIKSFQSLPSPIKTISNAFPDALVYNGDVSGARRVEMQTLFNSDEPGTPNLIIAQGDAMREGVSVHDTSGKAQRVLIHLGMPGKPTAAIQQEGRIYRTGQASDAIFRYLTIGTAWERIAFASTIATRAATAENLAMGEHARGLKQAFISAYEDAGDYPAGMEGEGKGGKAADAAAAKLLTPWDLAKSLYFGTKKYKSGRSADREGSDYFATPEPIGLKMVAFLDARGGDKLLEPSGGHGAIARWFPENTDNRSIEQSAELASRLSLNFTGSVITGNFEDHKLVNKYDGIAMNPPYGVGGKIAAEHVEKAIGHLRNGGRIVALIPTGPAADKKFDKLLYESDAAKDVYLVANIILPKSTFDRAGTSVSTRIIVLEKQTDKEKASRIRTQSTRDYSQLESNEALFDRLEDLDVGARTAPPANETFTHAANGAAVPVDAHISESVHKMDSKHTKTGDDLFVVNFDADMGDNYNAYNDLAKANNGFYVRAMMRQYYKPVDGKPVLGKPTFVFKSEGDREAFLQALKSTASNKKADADSNLNDNLLYSKTNSKGKNKGGRLFTKEEAQRAVDDVMARLSGAAGIKAYLYTSQAQFLDRFNVPAMALQGQTIYGAFDDRRNAAYLILDNFSSIAELRSTLVHEVLAHGGLHTVIGTQKYQQFIAKLNASRSRNEFKELWARIDKDYAGASDAVKAEEVFANFVQNQPERGTLKAWWFELTKWLRRQLEGLGIIKTNISRNDMEDMMQAIVRGFDKRKQRTDRAQRVLNRRDRSDDLRFQSVYHGTPHTWSDNKVSFENVGSGEGNQAYGWGVYFAGNKEIAKYYRDKITGDKGLKTNDKVLYDGRPLDEYRLPQNRTAEQYGTRTALVLVESELKLNEGNKDKALSQAIKKANDMASNAKRRLDSVRSKAELYGIRDESEVVNWEDDWLNDDKRTTQYDLDSAAEYKAEMDAIVNALKTVDLSKFDYDSGYQGNIYQADIPEDSDLLDWDIPLTEDQMISLYDRMQQTELVGFAMEFQENWYKSDKLGRANIDGQDLYVAITKELGSDKAASLYLNSIGIPGLKYLDGNSRSGNNKSYNYVIWNDGVVTTEALNDIRFSMAMEDDPRTAKQKLGLEEEAEQTLKEKITENYRNTADTLKQSSFWSRLNEGIFDGLHGIKKAEEAAGITDPNKMGYVSARLASGLSDVLHGVFHYGAPMWKDGIIQRKADTKGLLEVFGMLPDGELNNWLAWMGANRAKQLKAEGRENNLSQSDIDELLALADGKEQLFEAVRAEYNKINSAILDVAQGAGLISEAQRSGFDEEYYVPFFREQEVDPEMQDIASMVTAPFTKKGIAGQSAKIKALKGGKQSTKDLLENIILRHTTMLDASLKNKAMLEVTDNLNGTEFMTEVDSPEFAKLSQRELNSIQRVKVMRDGQAVAYAVTDPALLRGLIAVNDVGSQALFNRMGRSAKRFLTTGITLSPDFIFKNFVRDAAHAWMINKDDFKFGTDSIKGLQKAFKEDEAYRDLIFSGAAFQGGYVHGADPEAAAQQVRRALAKKGLSAKQIDGYMGTLVTSGQKLIEKYRNASDKVENANRLSTYEAALAKGKSRRQAAYEAKDLMDYALKGNFALISTMIDFLPFFNARLQGMYKLVRASAAGDNDKVLKVLSANLAMKGLKVAAFSLALAAMNDDDERYQELPDWDKDANWHFWLGDDHLRIPKPFELGIIFGTLPERLLGFGTGSQTGSDLGRATAHALFNTMALNPIPQIALPVVEVMTNKSFFKDAPIEGMGDEQRMPGDRYNAYTSDIARELGQLFNVSPKKIEHLVNGYAGTLGGYVLGLSDMMARQMLGIEKADTPISRYPVIKAFYGGDDPKGSTYYQAEFYKALDAANQAYGSYKRAAEEQDTSRMMAVLEDNRDKLGVRIALNRVQRQVSALSKQAEMVNNSTMSGAEKREKLDAITRQKNAVYQRAYLGFNLREW